jgi:hypothetical protein
MRKLLLLLLIPGLVFGANEPINVNSLDGKVKETSSTVGSVAKPFDFSGVTVTGLGGGAVSSVFGRTGDVVALTGDYSAFYPQLSGSYSNPAWITSLIWSKITGAPTTLAGYGITDAQPLDSDLTAVAGLTTTSFGRGFLTQADAAASRTYIGAQVAGSYESALGNPSTNGYVLSSTTGGTRSWIAPASGGAPTNAPYIVRDWDPTLTNEFALSSLATGLLKNTTGTGNLGIAVPQSDYWDTSTFGASGGSHAIGLVPDPGSTAGTTRFLREDTQWVTPAGGGGSGTVTSITATSPIVVTPTPLTATGVVSLNTGVDLAMQAAQSITLTNASTNSTDDVFTLDHESTGTPAGSNFGTSILFKLEDSTTPNVGAVRIRSFWTDPTHNANLSQIAFDTTGGSLTLNERVRIGGGLMIGGVSVTDPGSGSVNIAGGIKISGAAGSGKVLQGNGTLFGVSTPTWPTTAGTARKIVVSDGTNLVSSTETWAVPGASGNVLTSNGINWTSAAPSAPNYLNLSLLSGFSTLTTSTSYVHAGWGNLTYFTPTGSGIILVIFMGNMVNNAAGGATVQARFGTGTAPVSGVAAAGSPLGPAFIEDQNVTNSYIPYTSVGLVTGVVGTQYWFDMCFARRTTGSAGFYNTNCIITELK